MSKQLTFKPRAFDINGEAQWHDYFIAGGNAITAMMKGKTALQIPMILRIAGRIQAGAEAVELGQKQGEREIGIRRDGTPIMQDIPALPPFTITMKNGDAHQFWMQLQKLAIQEFGDGKMPPGPPGVLYWMLSDFAKQLGEVFTAASDEDVSDEEVVEGDGAPDG